MQAGPILTVMRVAAEGGGYRIDGQNGERGWRFRAARVDHIIEGEEIRRSEPWVSSLEEALRSINSGWPRLRPVQVHPLFAAKLLEVVSQYPRLSQVQLGRWKRTCAGEQVDDE